MFDARRGKLALLVSLRVALILIESCLPVGARHHLHHESVGTRLQILHRWIAHNHGASSVEVRCLAKGIGILHHTATFHNLIAAHVEPAAFWQPRRAWRLTVSTRCLQHRSHKYVVAEHVLVLIGIGLVGFRPVVVERSANGNTRIVSLPASGVDVWHQPIAQLHRFKQEWEVGILPDATLDVGLIGGVSTEDGCEDAELHPAQIQFRIIGTVLHVAAQVVAPVAEAHVGGRCREVRLPSQCGVVAVGIA